MATIVCMCSGVMLDNVATETDTCEFQPQPERTKYAILLNGDYEIRHQGNVVHAYRSLLKLGFHEEHIFVLSCNDPRSQEAVRGRRGYHGTANLKCLRGVVDHLSRTVDGDDLLIIYGTGHGDRENGLSRIVLDGISITAVEYREIVERIPAEIIVSVMDQCFAGGFPEELSRSSARVIAMSGTDGRHETECGPCSKAFWNAFWYSTADSNGDGAVSVRESHEYAVKNLRALTWEQTHGTYLCSGSTEDVFLK